jgi:uncharacterized protein (TIGR00251 family)
MTLPLTSSDGLITPTRDGLRVAIRLTRRARSDRLVGIVATAAGGRAIKATVTAPAQDGQANEALLQLLARAWRLPRRDLSIVVGAASRTKTVRVAGDPHQLLVKLSGEIASLPGG